MSSELKPYARYKDSGVEWLGEVPGHWGVKRLKYVAELELSNVDKKSEDGQPEVRLCNYTDVYYNDLIDDRIAFMRATASQDQVDRLSLVQGDVVITKDSEDPQDIGVPAYVATTLPDLVCGYHLALLRSRDPYAGEFLYRFLSSRAARERFAEEARGMTRFGLGKYSLENLELPVPPLPEQHAIADYLGAETARIDALISEQRELIQLLKEKRQALISHCVTQGLNPDVPMKDSGVEWLGEVPEHWEVVKLKRIASIRYGIGEPPDYVDQGTPLVRATDIREGRIDPGSLFNVNLVDIPNSRVVRLQEGDIIVVRSGAYTGDSSIVPRELQGAIAGFDLVVTMMDAHPKYTAHCLLSSSVRGSQFARMQDRSAQPHLNAEQVGSCWITLPPLPEQHAIADYLDTETARIDALMKEAEETITLMQEHRSALISACVTGKVRVPGVADPAAEERTA